MGPYKYDCPERILKLLTPTSNKYALKWREECWKRIQMSKNRSKLQVGDVLEFEKDFCFRSGFTTKRLAVKKLKPLRFRFVADENCQYTAFGSPAKLNRETFRSSNYRVIGKVKNI